jgi:CheY-like chemotaxis protein
MSNKLLVIENEQSEFNKVKNIFNDCFEVFPENHREIDYENNNKIVEQIKKAIHEKNISAIILDISLQGDSDTNGLEVIGEIRKLEELKYKIIPIYCYSRHGNDQKIISQAFKKGTTNIFAKGNISNPQSDEILFLKQSLTALAFIYTDVCGKDALDLKEVIQQISKINKKLQNIDETTKTNLNAILQFSTFQNIFDLIEINENNKETIANAIGGEKILNNLLQTKWFVANKEQQEQLVDNVADIFSNIPILSPIAAILKGITLISKSVK